jgi:hypothetical protein
MSEKEIRYTAKSEHGAAEARFIDAHAKGAYGKSTFVGDCLSVGFIMKETGFTDVIKMLDADPSFNSLSAIEKRNKLISVLAPASIGIEQASTGKPAAKADKPEPVPAPEPVQAKPKAVIPTLGQ